MRTINIKKTEVAVLKLSGMSTITIAKHYGITQEEAISMLTSFGFYKTKKQKERTKEYTINLIDDASGHNISVPLVETQETIPA